MNSFIKALPATRPPFLLLSPVCVILSLAFATKQGYTINVWHFVLVIIGAIFSAVAVNTVNEYQDFQSGLDLKTNKTPFSGGSGLLENHPELVSTVKNIAILSSVTVSAIGVYFTLTVGAGIIIIGLLGLLIIWLYTSWLNKHPWLCYLSPGLGFGLLMVLGAHYSLTSDISMQIVLFALIPFLQINNLLLLNQYPDIAADKAAGRNHLVIAYGTNASNIVFLISSLLVLILIIVLQQSFQLPKSILFALVPACLSLYSYIGMHKHHDNIVKDMKYLAANALCVNLTPIVISLALFID
ncbi:prenyltransferase [Thalassotalea ganghwensis]